MWGKPPTSDPYTYHALKTTLYLMHSNVHGTKREVKPHICWSCKSQICFFHGAWHDWKRHRIVRQSHEEIGDKPRQIKRPKGALWPCYKVEGCEKRGVKQYPGFFFLEGGGFLIISPPLVDVRVWELWLNKRETCSPPLLTASIGPNEALIGGVGCCSLEKHRVSKAQWRWQQRLGKQWPKRAFLWTVCSAITSKARWQNIHQISMENIWKGPFERFCL